MSIPIFRALLIVTYRHYDDLSIPLYRDAAIRLQCSCAAIHGGSLAVVWLRPAGGVRKILSCEIGWRNFAQAPFSIQNAITGNCFAGGSGRSFTAVGANRAMCDKASPRPM